MGALDAHRGKTIDQLIQESVEDYLSRESFGSCAAVDNVLIKMELDTKPFKFLYPALGQMMNRRHRIVHEADLSDRTGTVSETWGVVDDWQLMMWLSAVPAFYYKLRMSVNAASDVERTMYERHREAMLSHVDFANQLLAFPEVRPELRTEALLKIAAFLGSVASRLDGSDLEPVPGMN